MCASIINKLIQPLLFFADGTPRTCIRGFFYFMNSNLGLIRTNMLISAFENEIDWDKVDRYFDEMKLNDIYTGHYGFPPILGYPSTITSDMVSDQFLSQNEYGENRNIVNEDIGKECFIVTNGHHRALAASKASIYYIDWEIEYQYKHLLNNDNG